MIESNTEKCDWCDFYPLSRFYNQNEGMFLPRAAKHLEDPLLWLRNSLRKNWLLFNELLFDRTGKEGNSEWQGE